MAQGVRRLHFDPVGAHLIPARGGHYVVVFSGQTVGWQLHAGDA